MDQIQTIISCESITKDYVVDKRSAVRLNVLKGINLKIFSGEIVTIVGASGSGKSTLLHILGGLDAPTQGKVFWQGKDIYKMNDKILSTWRSTFVGFIFQFHHLLMEFTALENVMIPMMIRGESLLSAQKRAIEILEIVGLDSRKHHKPPELSGGEQQRVAVARALANKPQVIFADEPTGNLDSVNSEQLYDLLCHLNKTQNQTLVIVTHNENFAARSDRTFRMIDGLLQLQ